MPLSQPEPFVFLDLHTIETIIAEPTRETLAEWRPGDAWLAGGSWLFSEPQPHLDRLIDLTGFGWPPITMTADGLVVAATCTVAQLQRWAGVPPDWTAAALIDPCCHALVGSFKVWTVATVGGNMCLALPAGPMTALTAALEGECLIWGPNGGERTVPALDFVTGDRRTVLKPGEVLRSITLPAGAMRRRCAVRQISLSPLGRSGALLIGTLRADGAFTLTITASTPRPYRLDFAAPPSPAALQAALEAAIGPQDWHDDVHGRPDWRRHVTGVLAADILDELTGGLRP